MTRVRHNGRSYDLEPSAPGTVTKYRAGDAELRAIAAKAALDWAERAGFDVRLGHEEPPTHPAQLDEFHFGAGYHKAWTKWLRKGPQALTTAELKTLGEGDDASGGYLVPARILAEIARRGVASGVVPYVETSTVGATDAAIVPRFQGDDASGYPSDIRFTVTYGGADIPTPSTVQTSPVFGHATVPIWTMLADIPMSLDMMTDSAVTDFDTIIAQVLAESVAAFKDHALIAGTGHYEPGGLASALNVTTTDSGYRIQETKSGDASHVTAAGVAQLFGSLPAAYHAEARWLMNPKTMATLIDLRDTTNLRPLVTFGHDGTHIYGHEVILSPFVDDIGAGKHPLWFGNFGGLRWVDRAPLSIRRIQDFAQAEQNQIALLARFRGGSSVIEPWRIVAQVISA